MRRWQILLVAGLIGVASLLLVPLETLIPRSMSPVVLRLLALINPTIMTIVAVFVGELTARSVGLSTPLIDAWIQSAAPGTVLRRQLRPALIVGVVVAAILVIYGMTVQQALVVAAGPDNLLASFDLPLVSKLLYGGITEELLTRWGLVSLFAWIGWRLAGRPEELPTGVAAVAVTAAALLFAVGHLPVLLLMVPHVASGTIIAVLAANAIPGMLFGALYVRHGLEAAMIGHAAAHLFATIASAAM